MKMNLSDLMNSTLLLDLETTRSGKIRQVGAVLNGHIFERTEKAGSKAVLEQLDKLAQKADFVLGHNLLGHDFPILRAASPWLKILKKPVIDTLYLSPLAFPQNPYHRLVKNYKLVRSSINSPVEDAKLAASVFADQWESFVALAEEKATLIDFYRFCFQDSLFNTFSGMGISTVFAMMAPEMIQNPDEALGCFVGQTTGIVCANAVKETISNVLTKPERQPAAAYCMAWLQVAGGNSVLPPWVRHRFPEIPAIIRTLRQDPCGSSDCDYCRESHDPERQLTRFFGYPSFRAKTPNRAKRKPAKGDCARLHG
jgi:ATP-dependent DNA helicase RecQ